MIKKADLWLGGGVETPRPPSRYAHEFRCIRPTHGRTSIILLRVAIDMAEMDSQIWKNTFSTRKKWCQMLFTKKYWQLKLFARALATICKWLFSRISVHLVLFLSYFRTFSSLYDVVRANACRVILTTTDFLSQIIFSAEISDNLKQRYHLKCCNVFKYERNTNIVVTIHIIN